MLNGPEIARPIDINLGESERLPGRGGPRPSSAFGALAVLAGLLLVPLLILLIVLSRETSVLSRRLDVAEGQMRALETIPPDLAALYAEYAAEQQKSAALNGDLAEIADQQVNWSKALSAISTQAGGEVTLSGIQAGGRRVTTRGGADSLSAISAYVDRLRSTGYFNNVVLEAVSSLGTPLPLPTALVAQPTALAPRPTATATPKATATPAVIYPSPTWSTNPAEETCVTSPTVTWEPYPTYPPHTTWAPSPTWPLPWATATAGRASRTPAVTTTRQTSATPRTSPTASLPVRLENSKIMLGPDNVLSFSVTVRNLGVTPLRGHNNKPSGAVYLEGEQAAAGVAGQWRIALDDEAHAQQNAHRYRWGWLGDIMPGQQRTVTGKVALQTLGPYRFCIGLVQEPDTWLVTCQGLTPIVVNKLVRAGTPGGMPTVGVAGAGSSGACADSSEPDDIYAQAQPLSTAGSQEHTLHVAGDTDWVKLSVAGGNTYSLRATNLKGGIIPQIALYGQQDGVLRQIAPDAFNRSIPQIAPVAGEVRLDYAVTAADTGRFGAILYARIQANATGSAGCDTGYTLTLAGARTSAAADAEGQAAAPVSAERVALAGQADTRVVLPLAALQAPRLNFTIIMDLRGGTP